MATPRISGPRNIRRHAFEKLATLSLQNGDNHNRKDDIDRLCRLYGQETFPLPTHQNGDGDTATSTPPMVSEATSFLHSRALTVHRAFESLNLLSLYPNLLT